MGKKLTARKSAEKLSAKGNSIAENPEILSKKEQRKLAKELKEGLHEEEEDDESEEEEVIDADKLLESDSESEDDLEGEDQSEEEDEDEEDVALSDVELDDDADIIPFTKTTVNNKEALKQSLNAFKLPMSKIPFVEHLVVDSEPIVMKDLYDDMERELHFYKQGLEAAKTGRKLLLKDNVPFTRPTDYFAEMLKTDEHMDKLKKKMIEEESAKKASQEARRQRELKKFGKKVQHAKLQDRAKEKRDTLDKIKSLKRKRTGLTTEDDFDIAIEEAAATSQKKQKGGKRIAKDKKFGNGGKKRFSKSNTAESSADMSSFSQKKMKSTGGVQKKRLGKSRRAKR